MINIAVCDDIEVVSIGIKKIIQNHDFLVEIDVDSFTSGFDLFNCALIKKYDIIIMDIELSENENGMLLSSKIKNVYPDVIIIFFTGQAGYERELLNFEPFSYIEKPVTEKELINVVQSAIKRLEGWENKFYSYKFKGITIQVDINKIMYFISQSPYIIIKCIEGEYQFRGKIDCVEKDILEISNDFIRVSKSCLVNNNFIKMQSSKEIILVDDEIITITRRYAKKLIYKKRK